MIGSGFCGGPGKGQLWSRMLMKFMFVMLFFSTPLVGLLSTFCPHTLQGNHSLEKKNKRILCGGPGNRQW
jgi:hypothetical protein